MHQEPLPSGRRASVDCCHLELGLTWTFVAVVCHGGVVEICPCQQFRTTWTPVFHPPMQCSLNVRPRAQVVSCRVSCDLVSVRRVPSQFGPEGLGLERVRRSLRRVPDFGVFFLQLTANRNLCRSLQGFVAGSLWFEGLEIGL